MEGNEKAATLSAWRLKVSHVSTPGLRRGLVFPKSIDGRRPVGSRQRWFRDRTTEDFRYPSYRNVRIARCLDGSRGIADGEAIAQRLVHHLSSRLRLAG